MKPLDEFLDNVALGALTSKETLRATYDIARLVIERGIVGDFVEAGVYGGAQCAAMARALYDEAYFVHGSELDTEPFAKDIYSCEQMRPYSRRVHLFDSFSGIPQAGEHDKEFLEAGHPPGLSSCSVEGVKQHMEAWGIPDELLVYHEGLFEATVPWSIRHRRYSYWAELGVQPWGSCDHRNSYAGWNGHGGMFYCPVCAHEQHIKLPAENLNRIALLRLDADLYESTKVCLEALYPLLSPGGWLIVDDFGLSGARKAVIEYADLQRAYLPMYIQKQP